MYHHEQLPVPSVRKVGLCFLIVILSDRHSDVMFDRDRRQGFDFRPNRCVRLWRSVHNPTRSRPPRHMTEPVMLLARLNVRRTRGFGKSSTNACSRRLQGVHERKGVDDVKPNGPQGARVFCDNDVVIVGIGDAAAAWRGAVQPFVERLEEDQKSARPCHLLRTLIVQLQIAS